MPKSSWTTSSVVLRASVVARVRRSAATRDGMWVLTTLRGRPLCGHIYMGGPALGAYCLYCSCYIGVDEEAEGAALRRPRPNVGRVCSYLEGLELLGVACLLEGHNLPREDGLLEFSRG